MFTSLKIGMFLEPGGEVLGRGRWRETRLEAEVLGQPPVGETRARRGRKRHHVASLCGFSPAEFRETLHEELAPLRQRPRGAGAEMIQAVPGRLSIEQRYQRTRHVRRVDVIGIAERRKYRLAAGAGDAR